MTQTATTTASTTERAQTGAFVKLKRISIVGYGAGDAANNLAFTTATMFRFVHLDGSPEVLTERLHARAGHFMRAGMLASQLAALERLGPDERGTVIDIDRGLAEIVESAVRAERENRSSDRESERRADSRSPDRFSRPGRKDAGSPVVSV